MQNEVLRGSLAAFKLPEVLTFLNTTRKTGTLTLTQDSSVASLFFDDGALIYAGSSEEQFRLGSILLRKRRVTREEWDRVDALMRSDGGRFGEIAIQQGLLTEAQLRDFLKVQVSEIVYDCFVWAGGEFAFEQSMKLPNYAVTISVDLGNLIMEGARRIEEWEQCLQLLPDKSVVFRVVAAPKDEKITLTADEWKILFLINGRRTLEELCHDAEEDPFHVYRVVFGLLSNHLIEPAMIKQPDDTGDHVHMTGPFAPQVVQDETVRQGVPTFGADSTVREASDDTSLLVSSDANLSYSDVVKAIAGRLTIMGGDLPGTVIALVEPEYRVGRHRDNDIQLTDLGVSGFHARIFRGTDGYIIEDLKSRNGTWLNGTRVFHATLHDGDKLRLGATDMIVDVLA
jgi:hypothetical protein